MFSNQKPSQRQCIKVDEYLFCFRETPMLDCNQYVLVDKDSGEIALFDAGNGISITALFEGMKNIDLDPIKITKVFTTHEHVDHVIGLYPLMKIMKDNPPKIYAYGDTADVINEGDAARIFPGNLGISPSIFGIDIIPIETINLKELEEIKIFPGFTFNIHHTPGHSPGSICYYEPEKKILICGDLIFKGELNYNMGSFGRYDFPGSSLRELKDSINRMHNLDVSVLLPGHMPPVLENANLHTNLAFKTVNTLRF